MTYQDILLELNPSIKTTFNCDFIISDIINDQLYEQKYIGYTKAQALSKFIDYVLEQENKNI